MAYIFSKAFPRGHAPKKRATSALKNGNGLKGPKVLVRTKKMHVYNLVFWYQELIFGVFKVILRVLSRSPSLSETRPPQNFDRL
jgi:hypothetical protein